MFETLCIQNHSDFVMVLQKIRNTLETNYLYELSLLVVTTDSSRKDVAKKLPGTEQFFQGEILSLVFQFVWFLVHD